MKAMPQQEPKQDIKPLKNQDFTPAELMRLKEDAAKQAQDFLQAVQKIQPPVTPKEEKPLKENQEWNQLLVQDMLQAFRKIKPE